jgi:hypothetical protein
MTRGLGGRQRKDRLLTTSKIISYLAVRPFTYQELQKESKIQRKRLRDELDELVMHKLVIRHKFSAKKDRNLKHNMIYYLLDCSKTESKQLLSYYYNNPYPENIDGTVLNTENYQDKAVDQLKENLVFTSNDINNNKLASSMSHKEHRQLLSSLELVARKLDLDSVKRQRKLEHSEPSELQISAVSDAADHLITGNAYSFLDFLVKLSADEEIEGLGICNYSELWKIIEKKGLLDKYKNELR